MLGNFSFGDYFKEEVIPWAYEFVTEVLKLPKEKLYVTIYLDDDEAYNIWTEKVGFDSKRIFRLGKEDNFWEHGQGPCGPCSEIHFDRGNGIITTAEEFIKAADDDRVVEFWNLVFTQFDKDEDGNYNKLSNPNIDTGMGLERIACIMQGKDSIFEIDTIKRILDEVCKIAKVQYGKDEKTDISIRIITDHIRSTTFMISDDILPLNEGRGYVLRRLIRRAARHGKTLGITGTFLTDLCDVVINNSFVAYPELKDKADYIKKVIKLEEERFAETLDGGIEILNEYVSELQEKNGKMISGDKVFRLYDTYGFPLELTAEILEDKNISIDLDGFNDEMKKQRDRGRANRSEYTYMGTENNILDKIPSEITTEFEGYDSLEISSSVNFLVREGEFVSSLTEGDIGVLLSKATTFYSEMGGQIGDVGIIYNEGFEAEVVGCKKNISGKIVHFVKVKSGSIKLNDIVCLKVDNLKRSSICKNHTATHMLQEALIQVLGSHVHQSGSLVEAEKLRFDFTHFAGLTEDEVKKVETIVNEKIMCTNNVHTAVMSLEEAKNSGATALFDDKYGDSVRVVSVGDFSKELCGGTHVKNTGEIGVFKIISEAGVAAGIRRIEAVTGFTAIDIANEKSCILKTIEANLKCSEKDIQGKIEALINELKEKEKEIGKLKTQIASGSEKEILNSLVEINGVKLVYGALKDIEGTALRNLADKLKNNIVSGVVVLGSSVNGKVQLVAMATPDVVLKGVHCGMIIKETASICGGGGGGRSDMAQAGGKDSSKLKDALENVKNIMGKLVK